MFLQIVLVAAAMKAAYAWPIIPLDGYSRTDDHYENITCGTDIEFQEETHTNYHLTFVDYDGNMNIPAGCYVHIRIAVQDLGLVKYGIQVSGTVDITDSENGNTCSSSALSVADEDVSDDEMGSLVRFCNDELVAFQTIQDMLVIELTVGDNGASGTGFDIVISPQNVCGGIYYAESTNDVNLIKSPYFPEPYPIDVNCIWEVVAPAGYTITLDCKEFDLNPKKKCADYLMVVGSPTKHCGNHFEPIQSTGNTMFLNFRSAKPKNNRPNTFTGFSCTTKFKTTAKNLLLAKFLRP